MNLNQQFALADLLSDLPEPHGWVLRNALYSFDLGRDAGTPQWATDAARDLVDAFGLIEGL